MIQSDLFWYWNQLKIKPSYREKNLLWGGSEADHLLVKHAPVPIVTNRARHVQLCIARHALVHRTTCQLESMEIGQLLVSTKNGFW